MREVIPAEGSINKKPPDSFRLFLLHAVNRNKSACTDFWQESNGRISKFDSWNKRSYFKEFARRWFCGRFLPRAPRTQKWKIFLN
jgi:hypothetical protein